MRGHFTSRRTEGDRGYGAMAERMVALAAWKGHVDHQPAQRAGRQTWYADYQVRVARAERAYGKM